MDVTEDQSAHALLRRCAAAYEALVQRVLRRDARGDDEDTLRWIGMAATAAWMGHPGRFADPRLEAIALRIGQKLTPLDPTRAPARTAGATDAAAGRRRVLHVATAVYETGGHTRLIENWVRTDPASLHSLVLLDQQKHAIRAELARRIRAGGGEVIVVPPECRLLERAAWLRWVAQSGYDCVILHHHPNDVVPLVALATPECPPVAVMNHADHIFWLGVSVADVVIAFRAFSARISLERRGARQVLTLPIPLVLDAPLPDREAARARLGITPDEVVLFTMGSFEKFRPAQSYDFFRTLGEVLRDNPTARLYVVGVNLQQFGSFGIPLPERVELLGVLSEPSLYVAAADLNLSGFPYGSYTALFETAARGICPVLLYAPTPQADLSGDPALNGLITSPVDEADYVARLTALIKDPTTRRRLGQIVGQQVTSTNCGDGWRRRVDDVYKQLLAKSHNPAPLAAQDSMATEDDLNLARFNEAALKVPLLRAALDWVPARATAGEAMRVFIASIQSGDTLPTLTHLKSWIGFFGRRLFKSKASTQA